MKKPWHWFKALTITKKVFVGVGAFIVLVAANGNHQTNLNSSPASHNKSASSGITVTHKAPVITTKSVTETDAVPFDSTSVDDSSLPKGQTKITTAGVNGSKTLTYLITYTDGKQTGKKLVGTNVDVQPITQVTAVGTYVAPPAPSCPNGTYVNTYGNTVCSPYTSNSAPAGATAQCVDGTYSFSQTRSGTCSHRGGVSQWL